MEELIESGAKVVTCAPVFTNAPHQAKGFAKTSAIGHQLDYQEVPGVRPSNKTL
jgi:hypothetical protein